MRRNNTHNFHAGEQVTVPRYHLDGSEEARQIATVHHVVNGRVYVEIDDELVDVPIGDVLSIDD